MAGLNRYITSRVEQMFFLFDVEQLVHFLDARCRVHNHFKTQCKNCPLVIFGNTVVSYHFWKE